MVNFVPVWRIGESARDDSGGCDCCEEDGCGESGCERIVTRGTKVFQLGQVEVSVRADQTFVEGARMKLELPMWRVAFAAVMEGVERVEFVGSGNAGIVVESR